MKEVLEDLKINKLYPEKAMYTDKNNGNKYNLLSE